MVVYWSSTAFMCSAMQASASSAEAQGSARSSRSRKRAVRAALSTTMILKTYMFNIIF